MATYKLIYLNLRGRAETIRLIFAAAGVKYEDHRISPEELDELKPKTAFGVIPVLEVNGRPLSQSITICRYLAQEHGLAGQDKWERALVESVGDAITDLREEGARVLFLKDENEKAEKTKEFVGTYLPKILGNLEQFLISNKGGDGWFVGNKMTWADLHFYTCAEGFIGAFSAMLDGYPKLKALFGRVAVVPKVQAHLKSRPVTTI